MTTIHYTDQEIVEAGERIELDIMTRDGVQYALKTSIPCHMIKDMILALQDKEYRVKRSKYSKEKKR